MKKGQFVLTVANRLGLGGNNRVASVIAVVGVSCALAVMLLTLSVSQGFKTAIREKLSGFTADISVTPPYNYNKGVQSEYLTADPSTVDLIKKAVPGADISFALRQPGMLKTDDDYSVLLFTAFAPDHDFAFEKSNLTQGRFPSFRAGGGGDSIVVSQTVASRLGLKTGDRVSAFFFAGDNIRARKFTIAGLYSSNFGDFDKTVCYAPLDMLQRVCGLDSLGASAIEVRGVAPDSITQTAERLQTDFVHRAEAQQSDSILVVDNITHSGAMYLNWLDLLDTNVVVIFILMCCVAAITLVSSLFILILNNIPTIGLLRALGASKPAVRNVFVAMAMRLVGSGMVIGNLLALLTIWIQQKFLVFPLDPESYYLSHVPMVFNLTGIVLINVGVAAMSWLVLILPARVASSISPARTMRCD